MPDFHDQMFHLKLRQSLVCLFVEGPAVYIKLDTLSWFDVVYIYIMTVAVSLILTHWGCCRDERIFILQMQIRSINYVSKSDRVLKIKICLNQIPIINIAIVVL